MLNPVLEPDRPTDKKRQNSLAEQVRRRDRNICQCCYLVEDVPETHHIQPLVFGGLDELSNLITLCGLCHKMAPDNPDKFLEYQKLGGAKGLLMMGQAAFDLERLYPDSTVTELVRYVNDLRHKLFKANWEKYAPRRTWGDRMQEVEDKRESIINFFKSNPGQSYTFPELVRLKVAHVTCWRLTKLVETGKLTTEQKIVRRRIATAYKLNS